MTSMFGRIGNRRRAAVEQTEQPQDGLSVQERYALLESIYSASLQEFQRVVQTSAHWLFEQSPGAERIRNNPQLREERAARQQDEIEDARYVADSALLALNAFCRDHGKELSEATYQPVVGMFTRDSEIRDHRLARLADDLRALGIDVPDRTAGAA